MMKYRYQGTAVCGVACRIVHLVHVAIPAPHCGVVLAKSLFRWSALNPGGRFFLQSKAFGLY